MLKKFFSSWLALLLILVFICTNRCYAITSEVTEKNLGETFEKFISSNSNKENYKISVTNNTINIIEDDETYILYYDLTNKPSFSLEIPIQKGMSYDEFRKKTDNFMLPMLSYIAVANIQGVDFEDSSAYFLMSYTGNALNGSWSSENSYVIVDDTNMSDGVTIDKDENDTKTIYVSEFGERVMEYVNDIYKDKQIIKDSFEGINSYEFIIEKKEETNTSCKLVSTLNVNLDADFSKLNGYADLKIIDSNKKNETTEEDKNNELSNNVSNNEKIPYSGIENNLIVNVLYVIIGIALCTIVLLIALNKKK